MLNSSADVNDFIEYYKNIADEIILLPEQEVYIEKMKKILSCDSDSLRIEMAHNGKAMRAIKDLEIFRWTQKHFPVNVKKMSLSKPSRYRFILEILLLVSGLICEKYFSESDKDIFNAKVSLNKLILALELRVYIDGLKKDMVFEDLTADCNVLYENTSIVFEIGYLAGRLEEIDFFTKDDVKKIIHADISSKGIKNRWADNKKSKKEAEKIAEDLYSRGDNRFHNDVANEIYDLFYKRVKENFPKLLSNELQKKILSRPSILKVVKPIANECGRVRGKAGVTKKE